MKLDAQTVREFHCPRWRELPALTLYMDQVVIILEETLSLFAGGDEHVVTSTMINNYVKQKLVQPPEKKKYGREQLAALMVLSVLKRVLSITEAMGVLRGLVEACGLEEGYDRFCDRLEAALLAVFAEGKPLAVPPLGADRAQDALDAALGALAGKLLVQVYLAEQPPYTAAERERKK